MKKYLLIFSLLFVFIGVKQTVVATTLSEPGYVTGVRNVVENTNRRIELMVQEAQIEADLLATQGLTEEEYNAELDLIITNLVNETNEAANKAIVFGARFNVTIVCEYDTYIVGGREVLIDPLIVVGW